MAKTRGSRGVDELKAKADEAHAKILEARRVRTAEQKIEFIPHPVFEEAGSKSRLLAEILGPEPTVDKPRKTKAPSGLPPYLAALYETPLLTREQEGHLFRKMNYLKYRAGIVRHQAPQPFSIPDLDEIDRLLGESNMTKNQIITANLRLVVSIAKKWVLQTTDGFFELVSDGNMSLIRAVEKFDYARGNKFSTYASWAIMKNFTRAVPLEQERSRRFPTGMGTQEDYLECFPDTRGEDCSDHCDRLREAMKNLLGRLDDRERKIILGRFGLEGTAEKTLEQLGKELGVTKERIRQIESRAQNKLRKIAAEDRSGEIAEALDETFDG